MKEHIVWRKTMYSFLCDYSEGAHPRILESLVKTNLNQTDGYGIDSYCENACSLLKKEIGIDTVDIHFFVGGTQTNTTAISAFLRPHEAVISPKTGHIQVHETGAIEATGHKILTFPTIDGKLTPLEISQALFEHEDEHMAKPKLVYISNATEIGSIYTMSELESLHDICIKNHLFLFMDGARLGSALTAKGNDLTLNKIATLVDAFYIGGTKNGALLGEALVICNDALKADFRYHMKQKGALLAKGRLIGIQFEELFRDKLYFQLAKHSNNMATKIADGFAHYGYTFLTDSLTNQVFPILPNKIIEALESHFSFYRWLKIDDNNWAIRLVTSWATSEREVNELLDLLDKLHNTL